METKLDQNRAVKKFLFTLLLLTLANLSAATTLNAACSVTAGPVSFGVYDPLSLSPLDTIGRLTYRCEGRDHNISIGISRGNAPSFNPRQLRMGAETLNYNLFVDVARTAIWGDATGGTTTLFVRNPQPNNSDIQVNIFGRIAAQQSTAAGTYNDTLTVTINF